MLLRGFLAAWILGMVVYSPGSMLVASKSVHVVFSSHLDIGFNNIEPQIGWDNNVISKYFNEYYPRAVDIADALASQSPSGDRYIYTTSSWLVSLFLDCPPAIGLQCPDAATRAKVLRGIESGVITWHAHPHKPQFEFYDSSLLGWATEFTHDLDQRFGFKPKHTVMLRDVPGLTRAAIPILVAKGVKAVTVGVNQASAPPGVPFFTPFIWRDEASGTQLLAMWRPGGYGGYHRDLILDPPEQCIQAPGLDHVLCTSWRWDNSGPAPDVSDPLKMFEVLREEWAGDGKTRVFASTLDAFVDAVLDQLPNLNLTVVTDEIGDSWIWGVQSDPLKVANFRAASRARAACIADPACPSNTLEFYEFSRLLLKVAEHTWGVDVKKTLHDFVNYSNPDFYSCLPKQLRPKSAAYQAAAQALPQQQQQQQLGETIDNGSAEQSTEITPGTRWDGRDAAPCQNYEDNIASWERQASYVDWAIQALPNDHPVALAYAADQAARQMLAAVWPSNMAAKAASVINFGPNTLTAAAEAYILAGTAGTAGTAAMANQERVATASVLQEQEQKQEQEQEQEQAPSSGRKQLRDFQGKLLSLTEQQKPVVTRDEASNPSQQQEQQQRQQRQQQQQQQQRQRQPYPADSSGSSSSRPDASIKQVASVITEARSYLCGSWQLEVDPDKGGITSLIKRYAAGPGTDWARGTAAPHTSTSSSSSSSSGSTGSSTRPGSVSSEPFSDPSKWGTCDTDSTAAGATGKPGVLGQLLYHAYSEASYDFVWNYYGWEQPAPWWFPLDFGKVNSSHAWPREMQATARLDEIYEIVSTTDDSIDEGALSQLALRYTFPKLLVEKTGAPPVMWTLIRCPAVNQEFADQGLDVSVVWRDKPSTRLPEALWFSFKPAVSAVDATSWKLHKLDSTIGPLEVLVNGSQSMHAVSDQGISVTSSSGQERLQIQTFDTALVSPGQPTAFPNGQFPPCLADGMHFNLVNNVWGTNYVMWVPYSSRDVNLAFRFHIDAVQLTEPVAHAAAGSVSITTTSTTGTPQQ